jgi:predicted DNA-binding protein (UPF0251 family)
MPRRRKHRKIVAPPGFRGYRPYGNIKTDARSVDLLYEEYEAIKLADYDLLHHQEASKLMGISRPTFARIYESARRKIAEALVETKEINTVFGNATFDENWYVCNECHARFTLTAKNAQQLCPLCGASHTEQLNKR